MEGGGSVDGLGEHLVANEHLSYNAITYLAEGSDVRWRPEAGGVLPGGRP